MQFEETMVHHVRNILGKKNDFNQHKNKKELKVHDIPKLT